MIAVTTVGAAEPSESEAAHVRVTIFTVLGMLTEEV